MNLTLAQFERIEAYLKGKLSEQAKQNFEHELTHNPELHAEVQLQQQLRFGLETLALQRRIEAAHQRHIAEEQETVVVPLPTQRSWNFTYWAIVAMIVLMMGTGWLVYQNQAVISEEVLVMASQEMTYKSLPIPNANAAKKAEWFLALTHIQQKEKKKAKIILERISLDPNHPYQNKAQKFLDNW